MARDDGRRSRPLPYQSDAPRPRILVLRPDHLGDLLLTLPAVRLLRRSFARAWITCLVAADLVPLVERAVDVDEVLRLPLTIADQPPDPGSLAVHAAARPLRGRFDLALLPRPSDPWSGPLVAAAEIPIRIGHPEPATLPFLTDSAPEDTTRHVATEAEGLARCAAAILGAVGAVPSVAPSQREPFLRLRPSDHARAAGLLSRLGMGASRPVVVHPTAGWELKTWPIDRWTAVVSDLRDRLRSPVLLVGRPADRATLEAIGGRRRDVEIIDDVPIGVLGALQTRARLVVGMDSGALHLAALLRTPVVGLFGPFAPQRMGTIGATPAAQLWSRLPCSPCGTLEAPPCGASAEPVCLRAITPREVVAAALALDRG